MHWQPTSAIRRSSSLRRSHRNSSLVRCCDDHLNLPTLRSDFWWLGVRFEGEYQIRLQSVDQNYFDYFTTFFNGESGSDGDNGPVFHVDGGLGVFGSYAEDSFRVWTRRDDDGLTMKILTEP
jgi:hypothetical protein